MAKLTEGILGGFSGKVGTVVGVRWKGQWCMRSYVARICDRRSPAQLEQRSRFTAMIRFAQQGVHALRLGFKATADRHRVTEGNWFTHRNSAAFRVADGRVEVDYERIVLSEGKLANVAFGQAEFGDGGRVEVPFADDRNLAGTSRKDRIYLYAYAPALGEGLLMAPAARGSERMEATLPATWDGCEVHLYGFTVGHKGGVSGTAYLGSGTVGEATRHVDLPLPEAPAAATHPRGKRAQRVDSQQLSLFDTFFAPAPDPTGPPSPGAAVP